MTTNDAIRKLRVARKRLAEGQGRISRRNARRAVLGAMRAVRNAMDADYPRIVNKRPPAPREPKAPRKFGPRLPFRRAWDMDAARLFAAICADTFTPNHGPPRLVAHAGAVKGYWDDRSNGHPAVYFRPAWPDYLKWLQIANRFGFIVAKNPNDVPRATNEVIDLWRRFWSEPIPVSDIRVAAEHQAFLERRHR